MPAPRHSDNNVAARLCGLATITHGQSGLMVEIAVASITEKRFCVSIYSVVSIGAIYFEPAGRAFPPGRRFCSNQFNSARPAAGPPRRLRAAWAVSVVGWNAELARISHQVSTAVYKSSSGRSKQLLMLRAYRNWKATSSISRDLSASARGEFPSFSAGVPVRWPFLHSRLGLVVTLKSPLKNVWLLRSFPSSNLSFHVDAVDMSP